MYCQFFKLQTNPFNPVPGPNYHFLPKSHQLVLNQINHAISRETGVSLLLGIAGVGKTTLIKRHILKDNDHSDVVFEDLNVHASAHLSIAKVDYVGSDLEAVLKRRLAGKKSVFLLDHVDHFDDDVLEKVFAAVALRNQRKQPTLLIMVGLTDLAERFETPCFKPFKYLMRDSFILQQLTVTAVKEYINYRLRFVGYSGKPLFSKAAIRLIAKLSKGAPRMINTLCGNSLFQARMAQKLVITEEIVNQAGEIFSWGKDDLLGVENELKLTTPIPDQLALETKFSETSDTSQKRSSSQNIDQSLQEIRQMLANIGHDDYPAQSSADKKEQESLEPSVTKLHTKISEKPARVPPPLFTLPDSSQSKGAVVRDKNEGLLKRRANEDILPEPVSTFAPTSTVDDRAKAKFANRSKPKVSSRSTVESKLSPFFKTSAVAAAVLFATVTISWIVNMQLIEGTSQTAADNAEMSQIVAVGQEEATSSPLPSLMKEEKVATVIAVERELKEDTVVEKRNTVDDMQRSETFASIPEVQDIMPSRPKPVQFAKIASTMRQDKVAIDKVDPVTMKTKIIVLPSQNQHVSDNLELAAKVRAEARYKLAQQGVSFNKQGFLASAANGDNMRLKLFLKADMPVDVQENLSKNTALIHAVTNGNLGAVRLILNQKPLIDRKNRLGKTALILAVESKQVAVIKALLKHGANPRVQDASGQTALSIAQKSNNDQILSLLE